MKTCRLRLLLPMIVPAMQTLAADPQTQDQRLDLVPFGYQYRAHRSPTENPPETQWLIEGQSDVLAGVMWEEHRPVREVAFHFAEQTPDPGLLVVEVTTSTPTAKQDNRPTWWTRAYEPFPGTAIRSGNALVYHSDRQMIVQRLSQYPEAFRFEPDPQGLIFVDKIRLRYRGGEPRPRVVQMRAVGVAATQPLHVEIEWGFLPAQRDQTFDGGVEAYNGQLEAVKPLPGEGGVVCTGPGQWRSAPVTAGRRGIEATVHYVADDGQDLRFRPNIDLPTGSSGSLTYYPNRTVVTVRTAGGSFSFTPRDLAEGKPILVPSLGFYVARAGKAHSASEYMTQWQAQNPQTTRQRVRRMPEQSMGRALSDHYTANRPPLPAPAEEPPMTIETPDELVSQAWRLAYWHVKRRCIKEGDVYQIYIWPYKALLGQESWRIFMALNLLGEHEIPHSGFEPWFRAQGQMVARGAFTDHEGALNVSGWDLNHAQGHGSMLYAMAQHYLLTGDKAWLTQHLPNFKAACVWIERQRQQWVRKAGPDSWSAGLIPPCEMGDYADWRSLYQTSVFFWRGLASAAEAIGELEPETGRRWRDQAEDFRQAIQRAVQRSVTLTPVMRVADGSCRRYIPPHPYLRGLCDGIANPYGSGHAGNLVMDGDLGAATLGLGVLDPTDPLMDELLDVLEDVIYRDNWMVRHHTSERMPNRPEAWFSIGGYYYQCGYSQSALAHLHRDDVPNYLRSMFNQYAADVDPQKAYQFREHPNRAGEGNGGDKTFEVGAFLERLRSMFVMEDRGGLWLARATPRTWLQQGKRIAVKNAPSRFGTIAFEIVSDVDHGRIRATIDLKARAQPSPILLRLRHPTAAPLRAVEVNGRPHTAFDPSPEVIRLEGLNGAAKVEAFY
ncbi:MAG: hypothetical protein KA354_03430 [Phycisphaerae bacterium]|nr:hypothetical protein [Phycisphaerae bacterium]